jgi:hypothetical protein
MTRGRRRGARKGGRHHAPPPLPGVGAEAIPGEIGERFTSTHEVFLVLAVGAALKGWLAWTRQGIVWPDEIYQSLEQAHRLVFGYGFVPWEFQDGARSWLFPGTLAAVLEVGKWVGAGDGRAPVLLAKTTMVAIETEGLWASMRIALHLGGPRAPLLAGVVGIFFPLAWVSSGRCTSELASGALLAFSLLLLLGSGPGRLRLAGALAALAIFTRFQSAIFAAGYRRVNEHFSVERVVPMYETCYESVLQRPRGSR